MAFDNVLPISVGNSSTNADLATKLGQIYEVANSVSGTKLYRLVKNDSATTMAANYVVVTKFVLGVPSYKVTTTTTAANPAVCGVVPSAFTSTIADQAYFLLQISGPASPLAGNTSVSNTEAVVALGTGTAAGHAKFVVTTVSAQGYDSTAVFGKCTASAGVSAAGIAIAAILQGLV